MAFFFQALFLLEEGKRRQAVELFETLPADNVRYQAFLGWALFLSNKNETKTAFELISTALHQSQTSIFFETIACMMRVYLQQWNIAEKRIHLLLKIYNTDQLRTLLWYCQSRKVPADHWFAHF